MDYWNDILTEKSWKILQQLKKENFKFILIGGWAAYLWTGLHKSKDIDIALKDFKDLEILKREHDLRKNDNLKKYEIKFDEIDLDIYAPYFSKLTIPAEDLKNHTTKMQGFEVVSAEALLILKQGAEKDREHSVKGEKDRIDIMTLLLFSDFNLKEYFKLLNEYKLNNYHERLKKIIRNFKEIKYIDLNPREFKLRKEEIMKKIKNPS
jgi:hypothetical protein